MTKEFGGSWPDESQYFHHNEMFHTFFASGYFIIPAVIVLTIRRWCSPWAAPAEVEVLATGVGPG